MTVEKQEKNKKRTHNEENEENHPADEDQTMIGLTYDEYTAMEQELETLQEQVAEQKDSWLRTCAEFDNYKKRVQRDTARVNQDALASTVKSFLVIADDLERALKDKPVGKDSAAWVEGIELIYQKLLNQMKNQGVERMDVNPGDAFDPNIHEAITHEEHPDYTGGQIIDIVQPGYRITDRVIRPAMVRVAQ
ncbi:MAG: nucleotide exchange factor GrpE [Chloroflexi bacterium]|nr:nucleotide exchange factor GrpE [Chloroflexota bacterium]